MINNLASEWRESGIQEGNTVLIHSNIKRTFKRYLKTGIKLTPSDILDSFLAAVGPSGTLLFPLFNFNFTKGTPFDIKNTPSHMGALTEAARKHTKAVRTGHPIYSFVAIGQEAEKFRGIDNFSGYGGDSPFALLKELKGKIAVLDLPDQNSMTFYHYVEEMHQVPYRYNKTFTADYIDINNNKSSKTYGLFVRNIEKGVLTHVTPAGELMWKNGLYSGFKPKVGTGLRVISAQVMFDFISNIIESGQAENLLYKIKDK